MASWTNGTTVLGGPMNFCLENFGLLHGTKWKIGLDQLFQGKKFTLLPGQLMAVVHIPHDCIWNSTITEDTKHGFN